jgi:hypothetical protein
MRPIQITTTSFTAADGNGVAAAQQLLAAGDLTLVSSTVTLTPPRYVTLTSLGNLSGVLFSITGTSPNGSSQTEVLTGPNANTVTSTMTFATITAISTDGAVATDVEAGYTQSGYSAWWPLDIYTPNQVTTISVNVSGTINYSVEYTNEDPFDNSIVQLPKAHPNAALTNGTADQTEFTTTLMRAVRFKVNSGDGTARVTVTQQSTA